MCHKYNPWRDDVCTISRSKGQDHMARSNFWRLRWGGVGWWMYPSRSPICSFSLGIVLCPVPYVLVPVFFHYVGLCSLQVCSELDGGSCPGRGREISATDQAVCPETCLVCCWTGQVWRLSRVHCEKLRGFYRTEEWFCPDFADIKHDYTQEFYRSYSSFISKCLRTG